MTYERVLVVVGVMSITACGGGGGGGGSSPVAPSVTSTTTTPTTTTTPVATGAFSAGQYLVGSEVAAGRYYTDPNSGCYWERLSGVGGTFSEILANEATNYDAGQLIVDIKATDVAFKADSDCGTWYTTARHGVQVNITAGQWLVGDQIVPGRYFTDPASGCYWERLSGASGTGEILANEATNYDAGQLIVDIQASDEIFASDDDCGAWTTTAPHGVQANITPGQWLVGEQVQPGTYSASVSSGCYWERQSSFTGSDQIIDNEYVSAAGSEVVTILASDEGFYTDDDCGTWTLQS
jgi:hypothetical protein